MGNESDSPIQETEDQLAIKACIAEARQKAGDDDRAFVRYLNECYAAKMRSATHVRSRTTAADTGIDRHSPAEQLLQDERYLRNAQALARRTQGGTRVLGGVPVPGKEFLDCVAVGNDTGWECTGTLIAPDVVVTAGHCLDYATRVFFGSDVKKPGKIVPVRDKTRHPGYRPIAEEHDLMILLLAEPVVNIAPRKIAGKAAIDAATDGRVVGFGNTDPRGRAGYGVKRQVDVPIASVACTGSFGGQPDATAYGCFTDREIIAGKPLLAKDSCTGDSGGPFYIEQSKAWILAGATSRATNKAKNDCGDGGIYVRIEHYLDWIRGLPGVTLP